MANNEDAIDLMREVDALRRALVEAGGCEVCDGYGRICVSVVCIECGGTGIRADLTPETQAAVAAAKEQIDWLTRPVRRVQCLSPTNSPRARGGATRSRRSLS